MRRFLTTVLLPMYAPVPQKAYAQELSIGYCTVVFSKIFLL